MNYQKQLIVINLIVYYGGGTYLIFIFRLFYFL